MALKFLKRSLFYRHYRFLEVVDSIRNTIVVTNRFTSKASNGKEKAPG